MATKMSKLRKAVSGLTNITTNRADFSIGVKTGSMTDMVPQKIGGLNYSVIQDGGELVSSSKCKPFCIEDVMLHDRKKDDNGNWVSKDLPSAVINFKLDSSTEQEMVYTSMVFRGTTWEEIVQDFELNHKGKGKLGSGATALYYIFSKGNGMSSIEHFLEELENGTPIKFAQYKREYTKGLNFTSHQYYLSDKSKKNSDDSSNDTDY